MTKLNDDILASTGNTAKEQEMFFAGVETGEANAKNNAGVRAAPAAPVSTVEQRDERDEHVSGETFTRGWINLKELPGGMMIGTEGRFGPIPASTSCWITTSEREAERLKANGPVLEIFTRRHAPAAGDALDALRELVECDNIKKRIASMQVCVLETDDDVQELDAMMSDLARRQPAAWDAARAALAAQRKGDA